ncbi:hypothetical protein HZA85_00730 [Candidatus Uhrbacteria bacterium]|nr:hypothetical protein [Candidatus Uhrbacteria bacterium]
MGQLIGFVSRGDKRIAALLSDRLGDQPALVAYLDAALRANHATLVTARKIADLLEPENILVDEVSQAAVLRLGVHTDAEAMGRLTPALQALRPDALDRSAVLHIRLTKRVDLIPKNVQTFTQLETLHIPPPTGSQVESEDVLTFLRIFLCALAMLAGVTADPRNSCGASDRQALP